MTLLDKRIYNCITAMKRCQDKDGKEMWERILLKLFENRGMLHEEFSKRKPRKLH